jgi:Zn-dependent protease with chaperone function
VSSSPSVAGRALLAIGLLIGFYIFALAIAGALAWVSYADYTYATRPHWKIVAGCAFLSGAILWSLIPRMDRFEPPGPKLDSVRHPKLFAEIEKVARATRQDMPVDVFLVGDVNAWVAQRGGVMGFFSHRVMGLGLPLMQILTVSEFRAVLAHEFGHYHGGDTKLGPWIYKTRSAIGRTIGTLGDSWLQKPFLWYGNMFLRISHAVSRQQEFSADALASNVVGARPLVEGLKKVHTAAPMFPAYWGQEVRPMLNAGFLPPIADGFRRFTTDTRIQKMMSGALADGLENGQTDPYDTHPPLPERIRNVARLPQGPDPATEPPAISLVNDVHELERRWLANTADAAAVRSLKPVGWESVLQTVLLPGWREGVKKNAAALAGATIGGLPELIAKSRAMAGRLPEDERESATAHALWLAGAAATVALDRAGWPITTAPGAPIAARVQDTDLLPFDVVNRLANGTLSADDWRSEAARLGVDGLALGERP